MKLYDINLPVSYEWSTRHALIFTSELAERLTELYHQYGSNKCVPMPRQLADGRFVLSADILTEINPGGFFYEMWQAADKEILLHNVDVLPWSEVLLLFSPEVI